MFVLENVDVDQQKDSTWTNNTILKQLLISW